MSAGIKERMRVALLDEGSRGLTREELRRRFGSTYGLQLDALEADGHVLRRHRSRRKRQRSDWWRVVLVAEATPAEPVERVPEPLALPLDVPAAPACAIFDAEEPRCG